jgi:hypothetical protein
MSTEYWDGIAKLGEEYTDIEGLEEVNEAYRKRVEPFKKGRFYYHALKMRVTSLLFSTDPDRVRKCLDLIENSTPEEWEEWETQFALRCAELEDGCCVTAGSPIAFEKTVEKLIALQNEK